MSQLYYTPPSDDVFFEVKEKAMELWTERYPEDEHPHYAQEKIDRIKDIKNVGDNLMYIVAMFDRGNQSRLAEKLSKEARHQIRLRLLDGGMDDYLIVF